MRYFFTHEGPSDTSRIVLVESGSRAILEKLIPRFRAIWGESVSIDLVTCYSGRPSGLDESSRIYRVTDYRGPAGRRLLTAEFKANHYGVLVMICSAEPIMTKWKWMLAFRLPVKVMVANENSDCFWLDRAHLAVIRHFVLFRVGLTGPDAVRTLARLLVFPFALAYLILYATFAHARRALRIALTKPT